MNAIVNAARLFPVSDDETRGQKIRQRRMHHGIKSVRELASKSGISREALTAAEKDEASVGTYERIEAWLSAFEEETGADDPTSAPPNGGPTVEFHVTGNFGVDVVGKGPVSHIGEIEAAVERLVRAAQADPK